ncbi:hypothetical protein BH10PAT2_BH10PAT2_1570 [soil metagenome]
MPAFITETTDEQPQVLLITQQSSFSTAFLSEIHKKNMDVVVVNESVFSDEAKSQKLSELNSSFFYKIFWWWGELSEAPASASNVIEFLLGRREALTVGASMLKPFEVHEAGLEQWQRIFELQTRNLNYLQQFLPGGQLLLTGSLVGEREDYLTRLIYAQLSTSNPVLPDSTFSAATREEIVRKTTRFLFQPNQEPTGIYLEGTQFGASQILAAFKEKNTQEVTLISVKPKNDIFSSVSRVMSETLEGKKELLNEIKNWRIQPVIPTRIEPVSVEIESKPIEVPKNEPVQVSTKEPSSRFGQRDRKPKVTVPIAPPMPPTWYPEIDAQLEEMMKRQKPRVVSTFPPVIENRLKRYEVTKKQKIEQQKHLSHIPKTASKLGVSEAVDLPNPQDKHAEDVKTAKEIDSQIGKIFGQQRQVVKSISQMTTVTQVQKVVKKNKRLSKFIVLLGLALSVAIFAGVLAGGFFINQFLVENSLQSLIKNSTYSASEKKNRAKLLTAYSNSFALQTNIWQHILGEDHLKYYSTLADVGKEAASSITTDDEIATLAQTLWQQVTGLSEGNSLSTVVSLTSKTEDAYKKLSLIQAKIQNLEEDGDTETNKQLVAFNSQIQDKRKVLAVSQQFEQTLPFLLAQGGRKTYLIILQNNLELRATGGVIQAASLVTLQNGVIVNTQALNIAQLDASFQGQTLPPADLQAVLGQKNWLLRDSNWSASFPSAATQMSSFIEKSSNQKVDGVLALNLYSLQELIRATGPVTLPAYSETVTDKNLMEKVEYHSELAVVPTAAPDYLTVLLTAELDQILKLPAEKTQAFSDALYNSLKSDQMLVFVNDSGVASTLESVGWSGGVLSPNCPTQFTEDKEGCVVDSIFQVESNVGINRANFYIQRSVDQQIQVSKSNVSHQRTIVYNNTATSNSWPAGIYKNYLRFYLPTNAQNVTASINGQLVSPQGMIQYIEGDKKVVGFLVSVPIQQQVSVVFTYDTDVEVAAPFAYTFFDQKQSGTGSTPEQIRITPEDNLKVVYIAPQASVAGGEVTFSTTQDKHLFVGIKLR